MVCKEKEGQCFEEFMTRLKNVSSDCEFGELENSLIKDTVVTGVIDDSLRERMLREPTLTLEKEISLRQSAEQIHQLRELVKKNSICDFSVTQRNQFDKLRSMIRENTFLEFLNPKLPAKTTCDSSKFGIVATLEQKPENNWHLVDFKSRSYTPAEQKYCPLERETLAIIFVCSKLNEYLYGKKLIVESDHKPLKSSTTLRYIRHHPESNDLSCLYKSTTSW